MFKHTISVLAFVACGLTNSYAQNCENEDFENGNTSRWNGFTGNITFAGKVSINKGGIVNGQHTIMSGLGNDPVAATCGIDISEVEESGIFSLRLGNVQVGAQAERITHTFVVEPGKEFFLYKYAVILEDPSHQTKQQPRFEVRVFDKDGNLAPCGEFKVRAGPNAQNEGFQLCEQGFRKYWVKDWTVAGADLSQFVGEQVTIEFLTTDCALGGHAGYAYVEASCKKLDINLDGFCPSEPGFASFNASVTEGFMKYEWSNGSSGNTATYNNLNFGDSISVKVTTFTGCSSTFSKVLEPPLAMTPIPAPDIVVCKNNPFSMTALGQDFGYVLWDHNGSKETTIVETVNVDSTFSFEYFDVNGCATGIKDTIAVQAIGFDVDTLKTNVSCSGIDDGKIEIITIGGIGPFKYEWEDGNMDAIRNDLTPGIYRVRVSEDAGCFQELEIELEEPSLIDIDIAIDTAQCILNNGEINVATTGGVTPYTYSWTDDPSETGPLRTGLPSGDYSVTITDDNGAGCSRVVDVRVPEPELFLVVETVNPRCVVDDGFLRAVVQGGSGNYSYQWNTGETTQLIENLTAGDYKVDVTDDYGCSIGQVVTLLPPPDPLSITTTHTDAICSFSDGTATVVINGGLAPYTVLWSNGGATEFIDELAPGTYDVTVIDANDCERSGQVTVGPPPPLLEIKVESFDAICSFDDGKAQVVIVGGTQPYGISWLDDGRTTPFVDSLTVGTHLVLVTDANGCSLLDSAFIGPPLNLMELEIEMEGESYNLQNGQAEVIVTGGEAPYGYRWEPSGGNESIAEGLASGLYEVFVTDLNNCIVSDTVTVIEIPPIEVPNAFTPNGDGFNEDWQIKDIQYYPSAHISIFNRWGNLIFESNGYNEPWNGVGSSTPYPTDTYYYIIDLNIGIKPFTGYVDIIR